MSDNTENLTIRLLQELRADMQRGFTELRAEMEQRDAENAAILGALVSDVAKIKEAVLEFVIENGRMKKRIESLEDNRPRA
jgi:ABC-type transport system involved in cytochrome bd biosynthesis fused ATPase/permease subunit